MDPEATLRRLCRQHRVPFASARRLTPLLRRAAGASLEVRRNLLAVVEAALACEAEAIARRERLERQALLGVASVLHRWPEG